MKKILSLFFIFFVVFGIFSNGVQASTIYDSRNDVDASSDTSPTDCISFYDVLCQLPQDLRNEIFSKITEKSSIKYQNKYYSLVGFEGYQAIVGLVVVRRQSVKNPNTVYYDFIMSASDHLCYTRSTDILGYDGKHYNGFLISSKLQLIRLNNYLNDVAHFQAYPIDASGIYTYTDSGDQYACDIVFCSKNLVANDSTYQEITFPKMNEDINGLKKFNWGDHKNLNDKLDIVLEEEYNISEKTSILNIRINKFVLGQKLYYSNVMFGIDRIFKD